MTVETRLCPNCHREHLFFYGYPQCDAALPHGFLPDSNHRWNCRFCDHSKSHPIHAQNSEIKHCTNCNGDHWFISGWPDCDPYQPHGFMTYTGMEGRCQFCSGPPSAFIHNQEHR